MLKNLWEKKVVRFICVGITNTLIDLSILNTLVFLAHVPVLVANLISATTSIIISYFLNHHIVFRKKEPHELKSFLKFFAVTGLSIVLVQSAIIYIVLHILHGDSGLISKVDDLLHTSNLKQSFINLNIAKLFAVAGGMVWNFVFYHLFVFKDEDQIDKYIADA